MIITITGTPGSGKSTLAKALAARLGYRHYSIGDLRREHAAEQGLSLAAYNKLSETGEEDTDTAFDEYQQRLGTKEDRFVMDSRLGWHFIPTSIKLFVDADEEVRARRLLKRESVAEAADDLEHAKQLNRERTASDRARYLKYYGLDPFTKSHYDLILDSTRKTPDELVDEVVARFRLEREGV